MFFKKANGSVYAPLFLERNAAELFRSSIQTKKIVSVVPMRLNEAKKLVDEISRYPENKSAVMNAQIRVVEADMNEASKILSKDGFTPAQIASGMQVPIFYTEPMIQFSTPTGLKKAFYFNFEQLQNQLRESTAPEARRAVIKVADLNVVLSTIMKSDKDVYAFFPNPAFLEVNKKKTPLNSN